MNKERLDEIKDSINFQYELIVSKGIDKSALLFTDEEQELLKEVERLNNIINELEKWLVEWREMLDCPDFYEEGIIDCINDTLTKLQELKGSDKE